MVKYSCDSIAKANGDTTNMYDTTQLFQDKPKLPGFQMLKLCNESFKFTQNKEEDCPTNQYLNYACVGGLGRDLLCDKMLTPPLKSNSQIEAIRQSEKARWKRISLEGCSIDRSVAAHKARSTM